MTQYETEHDSANRDTLCYYVPGINRVRCLMG